MDSKLAMGLARTDARQHRKSVDGRMQAFMGSLVETVSAKFGNGRRFTPEGLRALVAEADRQVGTGMLPVAGHRHHQPATRARPKGEAYEMLSLHVMPVDHALGQKFELWSFRMAASCRRITIDVLHTGIQFHLHTVGRVIERSDNAAENPIAATAGAIVANAGTLFAAFEASKARREDCGIAMPFGPGMLAGTIEEEAVESGSELFQRHSYDSCAGISRGMPHPYLSVDGGKERIRTITMRTYVPGELMRPLQAEFTDKWEDLKYDHPVLEGRRSDYLWPTRQMWQPDVPQNADATAVARAAVRRLVFDPVFLREASKRTKHCSPPLACRDPDFAGPAAPREDEETYGPAM